MEKFVTVDCPYSGQPRRISVSYCNVPVTGTLQKSYKKMSFDCPSFDECSSDLKDQFGRCSAYNSLPVVIHD